MFRRMLVLFVFLVAGPPLAAQSDDNIIRLKLKPAGEPSPALKYQLLPDVPDLSPGNAAPLYYRAFSPDWYTWRKQTKVYEKIEAAMTAPLADLPRTDLGWITNSTQLRELDVGARREYCDWDLTTRMRTEGIHMLLPDMQAFRELSKLLALRARFYIADRQYDKAVYSMQTGLTMSRQVGEAPLLICLLVGAHLAEGQLTQLETLIQAPGAPNMYWALTGLPRPFFDLRKPFGGEKLLLLAEMPQLKDIETTRFGPEQLKTLAAQFAAALHWEDSRPTSALQGQVDLVALAIRAYPGAKQRLATQGWKAEDLEALPALQVVCIDAMREYTKVRDDGYKWIGLPYWQAQAEMERVQQEMVARRKNLAAEPFMNLIGSGLRVCKATLRIERRIAALRTIEAIRLYAAANDGRLPATLADIHLVPVPDDPTTGKGFIYTVQGDQFTLTGPVPAGGDSYQVLRYQASLSR